MPKRTMRWTTAEMVSVVGAFGSRTFDPNPAAAQATTCVAALGAMAYTGENTRVLRLFLPRPYLAPARAFRSRFLRVPGRTRIAGRRRCMVFGGRRSQDLGEDRLQ